VKDAAVLFPSPRVAVGRDQGWGVAPRISLSASSLIHPPTPDPSPPRADARGGRGEGVTHDFSFICCAGMNSHSNKKAPVNHEGLLSLFRFSRRRPDAIQQPQEFSRFLLDRLGGRFWWEGYHFRHRQNLPWDTSARYLFLPGNSRISAAQVFSTARNPPSKIPILFEPDFRIPTCAVTFGPQNKAQGSLHRRANMGRNKQCFRTS
jgi:hypothetical protein